LWEKLHILSRFFLFNSSNMDGFRSFFDLKSLICIFFPLSFILNKRFPHISSLFFVISSSEWNVVLFVVLRVVVWFYILWWCSFGSYWNINFSQSQIQSMILASTLQIWKHVYSGDLYFIILFVDILSLYVINLSHMSLFADLLFTFLTMLIIWVNLNE